MPEIQAFRGIRYDLGHVGSLSDVVAPPYDVIDETLQDELYKKHPCNVVRLILNRIEPGLADFCEMGPADRFVQVQAHAGGKANLVLGRTRRDKFGVVSSLKHG